MILLGIFDTLLAVSMGAFAGLLAATTIVFVIDIIDDFKR